MPWRSPSERRSARHSSSSATARWPSPSAWAAGPRLLSRAPSPRRGGNRRPARHRRGTATLGLFVIALVPRQHAGAEEYLRLGSRCRALLAGAERLVRLVVQEALEPGAAFVEPPT